MMGNALRAGGSCSRRGFMRLMAATAAAAVSPVEADTHWINQIPIIDTHIHLFDGTRPQGAPYTGPKAFTAKVSLPGAYRKMVSRYPVAGALAIEASPWLEDNLWLLEAAQTDDIMVGVVGFLPPGRPDFAEQVDRYHRNPLYRGIRFNNRGTDILAQKLGNPDVLRDLRHLAQADLVLDTANPSLDLLQAVLKLNDQVPDLRIIIDHLPVMDPTPDEQAAYESILGELRGRANIYVKLSEILHRVGDQVAMDLDSHRERLAHLLDVFGPERVMFGSDYPHSVGVATFDQVLGLTRAFFATQPRSVAENYYWKNSVRCYKWVTRTRAQRKLSLG